MIPILNNKTVRAGLFGAWFLVGLDLYLNGVTATATLVGLVMLAAWTVRVFSGLDDDGF